MKSNAKYTALEILTAAEIVDAPVLFGKVRVRIAGIAGIVKPDHLIKIGPSVKVIDIIVGTEKYEVKIEGVEEEFVVTEEAEKALAAKGIEVTKKNEDRAKAKKAEAEKAKEEVKE